MTTESDRELLELAAKAAGVRFEKSRHGFVLQHFICKERRAGAIWNPLTDDGDALRLAVKLGIKIELHPSWVYARAVIPNDPFSWREITEGWGITGEPLAATRRAIVRAAAEIARATHKEQT